jgi:hypothetical protein
MGMHCGVGMYKATSGSTSCTTPPAACPVGQLRTAIGASCTTPIVKRAVPTDCVAVSAVCAKCADEFCEYDLPENERSGYVPHFGPEEESSSGKLLLQTRELLSTSSSSSRTTKKNFGRLRKGSTKVGSGNEDTNDTSVMMATNAFLELLDKTDTSDQTLSSKARFRFRFPKFRGMRFPDAGLRKYVDPPGKIEEVFETMSGYFKDLYDHRDLYGGGSGVGGVNFDHFDPFAADFKKRGADEAKAYMLTMGLNVNTVEGLTGRLKHELSILATVFQRKDVAKAKNAAYWSDPNLPELNYYLPCPEGMGTGGAGTKNCCPPGTMNGKIDMNYQSSQLYYKLPHGLCKHVCSGKLDKGTGIFRSDGHALKSDVCKDEAQYGHPTVFGIYEEIRNRKRAEQRPTSSQHRGRH